MADKIAELIKWLKEMEFYDDWGGESAKALRDKILEFLEK